MKQIILLVALLLGIPGIALSAPDTAQHPETRFDTGVAITPRNFPHQSPKDMDDAFHLARELGRYSVFIYQWHEFNLDTVRHMMEKSRRAGLTPIIGLSPTMLDQGRKDLDLPESVRTAAGGNVSFANPSIRKSYIDTAEKLAALKPDYLCLATEINLLALQRLDEYLRFAALYKEAYRAVKRISPETKVFVSFQWEWTRALDAREMDKLTEHTKVISIFKPELDVVGLTTYPSPFHADPSKLPDDYYAWINHHIAPSDTVLLMEAGWPTTGSGSEEEQRAYINRLPELLAGVNVDIVAWALLHDVNLKEFDANLNTTGLLTPWGSKKKAFNAFRALRQSRTGSLREGNQHLLDRRPATQFLHDGAPTVQ